MRIEDKLSPASIMLPAYAKHLRTEVKDAWQGELIVG